MRKKISLLFRFLMVAAFIVVIALIVLSLFLSLFILGIRVFEEAIPSVPDVEVDASVVV